MVYEVLHRQHLIYLQRGLVSGVLWSHPSAYYTLDKFPSLQMLWWYMTCSSSVGSASAESHSAAPASAKSSTAAATAASKSAAESSPGSPTSAAASAIPAAETTAAATETTTAVTSSPAAAAKSTAGPIAPAAKHRVEAGSALGRRRPVFIVAAAAAESSALESTRRPLGLKTAEADGIHAVATGVELAKLAHHLYEE
jgi:hypothetical protein